MIDAIRFTFWLLNETWPFMAVIIGLMVGSVIVAKIIAQKDINL